MKNKHQSVEIVIAIISIIILLIAVVGISFAFFSYSKTGTANNIIQTGQIYMFFNESSTISLTNSFPITNSEAINGLTGANQSMTFTITGYSSGTSAISYTIYAIAPNPIDTPSGKTRFPNSQISVFISSTSSSNDQPITNNISSPTVVNSAVDTSTGWAIASGTIKAGINTEQVDTYTLKMFVNDTVRISDTNASVTWNDVSRPTNYCASDRVMSTEPEGTGNYVSGCKLYGSTPSVALDTDSRAAHTYLIAYDKMYYSLKIRVVGNA